MRLFMLFMLFIAVLNIGVINCRKYIPPLDSTQRIILETKMNNKIRHILNREEPFNIGTKTEEEDKSKTFLHVTGEVLNSDDKAYQLYLEQQEEDKFKEDLEEQNLKFLNLLESESYLILLQRRLEKLLKKQKQNSNSKTDDDIFLREFNKHILLFNIRNKKLIELQKEHDMMSRAFYTNLSILMID